MGMERRRYRTDPRSCSCQRNWHGHACGTRKIRCCIQCAGAGDFRLHCCQRAEVRFFRWRRFARTVRGRGASLGGGLELALACDMIIADKMARFAFPELRLGFIPGFGGIPRLKRDLGNAFVRDLLFTGRTVNATRAQAVGLVAQLAGEGEALRIARSTAAQITKYDAGTRAAAKKFIKPIPHDELRREIDLFCELFTRPAVMAALKKFAEDSGPMPYLP